MSDARDRLDALLPPDPGAGRTEPLPPAAAGSVPADLPRHLADRLGEAPGPDRSAQTAGLVAAAVEWGYDDPTVIALALAHRPTREKYGKRADREAARLIGKHRPDHQHVGQPCDRAGCPNTPRWMTGPPAEPMPTRPEGSGEPQGGADADEPEGEGAELLDQVRAALVKYVVFPSPETTDAVTLWIAATHAQPAWEHATRLVLKSPVKRCGKSRLLDLIAELSHDALLTVNISVAALVRSIGEKDPPVLLVDEQDAVFGRRRGERSEKAEELRGILNAGFGRRPYVRWAATTRSLERCPTFAMAALAAIGDLPDTIEDRAVIVAMRRRAPGERVQPLRRFDMPALAELGGRLHAWAHDHLAELEQAAPTMPVEDREADAWEPLVATADLAGGDWPKRARKACRAMAAAAASDAEATLGERLLADLKTIFSKEEERLDTATILDRLNKLDEAPWSDLDGKRLDARGLADRLRPYGVKPKVIRKGEKTPRGYEQADLADPWARYAPERNTRNMRNNPGESVADESVLQQQETTRNAPTSHVADVGPVADARLEDADDEEEVIDPMAGLTLDELNARRAAAGSKPWSREDFEEVKALSAQTFGLIGALTDAERQQLFGEDPDGLGRLFR